MGNHEEAQIKKKPHTWVEKTQVFFIFMKGQSNVFKRKMG
jgi:hypothetical protein